jgi:hypothetical protein
LMAILRHHFCRESAGIFSIYEEMLPDLSACKLVLQHPASEHGQFCGSSEKLKI